MASFHLAPYVRRLGDALLHAYGGEAGRVTLSTHLEDLVLPLDSAVPCGLILHELLSNALKHAFPHGQAGAIALDLRAVPDQHVTLRVADTGVGVPEGFDVGRSDSLGLQLVCMLTDNLGAPSRWRNSGTAFTLTFPLPEAQAGGPATPAPPKTPRRPECYLARQGHHTPDVRSPGWMPHACECPLRSLLMIHGYHVRS